MLREATIKDLDSLLELYLYLHEERIPEKDKHLLETWTQIIEDINHHIIKSSMRQLKSFSLSKKTKNAVSIMFV